MTFLNVVSGGALDPFLHNNEYPPLDTSKAKAVAPNLIKVCLDSIREELLSPKTSIVLNSKGFRKLVEMQYHVPSESINAPNNKFPADLILEPVVRGCVTSHLHLCVRCIGLLR